MDSSIRRAPPSRSKTLPQPHEASSAANAATTLPQPAKPASRPSVAEMQFTLLPLAQSQPYGSITSIAVWQHSIYLGTSNTWLLKYDLELRETDEPFGFSGLNRSASALRPALDNSCSSFSIVRVISTAQMDAKKHHRVKHTAAPVIDLQLCPALGVIFALAEGSVCAYDLRQLKFQHRLTPPIQGPIDRFSLFPQASHSPAAHVATSAYSFMSICLCLGKRLFVLVRTLDDAAATTWSTQQELLIPEQAQSICWIDVAHILIAFKKEYSVINSVTGDVVDLCAVEGQGETIVHRMESSAAPVAPLGKSATLPAGKQPFEKRLLHIGTKAFLHECDGEAHLLSEAMHYAQPPKAFGSTAFFAFTLDQTHVHVFLRPAHKVAAWRVVQNLPIANATTMWSDGGSLVLLAKGAQLYFLQPIHAHDRQKDQLMLFNIKHQYMQPPSPLPPNTVEWTREEALKYLTAHLTSLLQGTTHPFVLIIQAFEQYLATIIEKVERPDGSGGQQPQQGKDGVGVTVSTTGRNSISNNTPAPSTMLRSTSLTDAVISPGGALSGSTASSAPSSASFLSPHPPGPSASPPPPIPTRQTVIEAVKELQNMLASHLTIMWAEVCAPMKNQTPPATVTPNPPTSTKNKNSSGASAGAPEPSPVIQPPPKEPFLSDCMALLDEALFRKIYPKTFVLYLSFCRADDATFTEVSSNLREQLITPEYFGSTVLSKSPWMKKAKEAAAAAQSTNASPPAQQHKPASTDGSESPSIHPVLQSTPIMNIPPRRDSVLASGGGVASNASSNGSDAPGAGVYASSLPNHASSSTTHQSSTSSNASRTPSTSPPNSARNFIPASKALHPLLASPNPLLQKAFEATGVPTSLSTPVTPIVGPTSATSAPGTNGKLPSGWPSSARSGANATSTLVVSTLLIDSFQPSISFLRMLPFPSSPQAKLRLLQKVHHQLLLDAQKVYDPTGEKLFIMSADELLPIMCYVLVHSKLEAPFAETEFLMDFLSEESALGVDGYVVTTLQIALSQIVHGPGNSTGGGSGLNSLNGSPKLSHSLASSGLPPVSPILASLVQPSSSVAAGGGGSFFSPLSPSKHLGDAGNGVFTPSSSSLPQQRLSSHFGGGGGTGGGSPASLKVGSPSLSSSPLSAVGLRRGESSPATSDPSTSPAAGRLSLSRADSLGVVAPLRPSVGGIGSALLAANTNVGSPLGAVIGTSSSATAASSLPSTNTSILATSVPPSPPPSEWLDHREDGRAFQTVELRPMTAMAEQVKRVVGTGTGNGVASSSNTAAATSNRSSLGTASHALLSSALAAQGALRPMQSSANR